MKTFVRLCCLFVIVMMTSCVKRGDYIYLQDMDEKLEYPVVQKYETVIQRDDKLSIKVSCKSPELALAFNIFGESGFVVGNDGSIHANNTNMSADSRVSGYTVGVDGNITFPMLGKLHVEGLTRLQLQDTIAAALIRNGQLKDPLIIVRFLNFKVFFLTSSGGKVINVTDERCTFLEALAMAGGLDWYTRRDRIGVMREVDGKRVIHYLDPRSTDIFNDDFFVLQQNDIIFTEERPYKFFNANLNTVLGFISSITGLVTSAVSVVTLYKLFENWSW